MITQSELDLNIHIREGSQGYLVVRVVDHGGLPLALVVWVVNHWSFPGATARGGPTGRVTDLNSLPFAIHVLVPDGQVQTDGYLCSANQ